MNITVTQLNKYIKSIIENDMHLINVSVCGELSNFKLHTSGHCYMTLKDEMSAVRAVMFRGAAEKLRFRPENGMKVIATGRVSVYERDGQYQLYITHMQPDGVGDLHIAYEQLKERLSKEGFFDPARKKPIPKYPERVGVVTAPTGAAVRDIINVATRRYPVAEVVLYPVLVQGDGAAAQIAQAIDYFNKTKMVDVIIAGRGGGSIEDLWAFNEEIVATSIYQSQIPVISAVGHETDFTIADFVADMRAPTPSAAAELAVPSVMEIRGLMKQNYSRMLFSVKKAIENRRAVLDRFSLKNPVDMVNQHRITIDYMEKRLTGAAQGMLQEKKKRFEVLMAGLDAMSPLGVLKRGYAVAQNESGVVKSIRQLKKGASLTVRFPDGNAQCQVQDTEERAEYGK